MENHDPPHLESLTNSAIYMRRLVQTATEISLVPAGDEPTVLALLLRARQELGIDAAYYASCFGDDDSKRSYRTLLAGDPVWESQYVQNGWYIDDC